MPNPEFIAFLDNNTAGEWRVEAINEQRGEVYVAVFSGPGAEARAHEYASLKNLTHPIFKKLKLGTPPVVQPSAPAPAEGAKLVATPETFLIADQRGIRHRVKADAFKWTYDLRRGTIRGVPLPAIQRLEEDSDVVSKF